jgi:putative hydrolase of the HAD superfamily
MNKPSYAIIFDLRDVLFAYHPEHRGTANQFSILKEGFALLNTCASQLDASGRKRHKLYVLSNASPDSYANFMEHFSEIFAVFDGIIMSANCGFSKPDARMYDYLLSRYALEPSSCIFIDDKEVNVLAAKAAGMIGIVYCDHESAAQALKQRNVF